MHTILNIYYLSRDDGRITIEISICWSGCGLSQPIVNAIVRVSGLYDFRSNINKTPKGTTSKMNGQEVLERKCTISSSTAHNHSFQLKHRWLLCIHSKFYRPIKWPEIIPSDALFIACINSHLGEAGIMPSHWMKNVSVFDANEADVVSSNRIIFNPTALNLRILSVEAKQKSMPIPLKCSLQTAYNWIAYLHRLRSIAFRGNCQINSKSTIFTDNTKLSKYMRPQPNNFWLRKQVIKRKNIVCRSKKAIVWWFHLSFTITA